MIDANQRWDVQEAIDRVTALKEFKPLWVRLSIEFSTLDLNNYLFVELLFRKIVRQNTLESDLLTGIIFHVLFPLFRNSRIKLVGRIKLFVNVLRIIGDWNKGLFLLVHNRHAITILGQVLKRTKLIWSFVTG